MAFVNWGSLSGTEIYVRNIDRSGDMRLTDTTGSNFNPRWQSLSKSAFDFDGDARTDLSVFRPSDSVWHLKQSTAGFSATPFGFSTDKITPADYDGDGRTDAAVYRDGVWYLRQSTNGFASVQFGLAADIPVPGASAP